MINNLGYTKHLFILPFDHRSSFVKLFSSTDAIISAKWIIYEAFKRTLEKGIPKEEAAILVDEQFGDKILRDAKNNGFVSLLTTEKSAHMEFAFEYDSDFAKHIEKYKPNFAKALIHYNPEDQEQSKIRQQQTLKILSDYCHNHGYKFLLEVLIPPPSTSEESFGHLRGEYNRNTSDGADEGARLLDRRGGRLILSEVEGEAMTPPRWTQESYDKEVRPKLAVKVIEELQNAKVEPDVWKLEGSESEKDYQEMVNQARKDNRKNVGIVVLGRGENREQVEKWVAVGAKVKGVIGFAVGRTVFWQLLVDFKNGKIGKEKAITQIANNFKHFYDIFIKGK